MSEIQNNLWPGWETVQLIGRGSFGAVYEIQRDVFGDLEKAALKVISIPQNAGDIEEMYSDGYDDESITSTFQSHLKSIVAEYSLMRKMNGCSNIVNCDDVRYVQHDDGIGWDIFIKMELLTPLTKALPNDVPEETVVQIAKDMCAALELCKRHEIVHRDIKPQNIFVSPNGDYKLGDFGIAKTVEKTMGGTKIGTYKYMAPEVYNNQPYGSAADIYSLGLVLYWMLNERRMPFLPLPPAKLKAGMDEEARQRRLSGEAIPAPAHGSVELKRIVLKACAYDPKDRYSSATAMLNDLSSLGSGAGSSDFVAPKNNSTPTEQDNDMTIGPVFGDAQKQNSSTIETAMSDATAGPAFPPKTTRTQTPAVNQPKTDNSSAPKDTVEQHAKHNQQWYEFQYEEQKKQENKNKIIKIALGVLGVIALIAIVFALRSCGAGDDASGKEPNSDNKMTQSQQSGECVHQWISATCTSPATCSLCNKTSGASNGHNWRVADCTDGKKCQACGAVDNTSSKHEWQLSTSSYMYECEKCDRTQTTIVQNSNPRDYGRCGDNIIWCLSKDGKLTLFGAGEMYDYSEGNRPPWFAYERDVVTVVVEEGIENIGVCAFEDMNKISSVSLPSTIWAIDSFAFETCDSLEEITIPASVNTMGQYPFCYCKHLKRITILSKNCKIPDDDHAMGYPGTATIYGYIGSTAQVYAEKYGYAFISID